MRRTAIICFLLAIGFIATDAVSQNKVVVIPLNAKSSNIAGTDQQFQYNDNGTQAGANVYYDKNTGFVGIGPYASPPTANLDVASDTDVNVSVRSGTAAVLKLESNGSAKILSQAYSDSSFPLLLSARARGSNITPAAVQEGDALFGIFAKGYSGTTFGIAPSASLAFVASENWSDNAKGSFINFATTANGATTKNERMRIDADGNVGIGTIAPLSKLAVTGLPTAPPDASGNAGVVCVTNDGNFWLDNSIPYDCATI